MTCPCLICQACTCTTGPCQVCRIYPPGFHPLSPAEAAKFTSGLSTRSAAKAPEHRHAASAVGGPVRPIPRFHTPPHGGGATLFEIGDE